MQLSFPQNKFKIWIIRYFRPYIRIPIFFPTVEYCLKCKRDTNMIPVLMFLSFFSLAFLILCLLWNVKSRS